MKVIFEDNHLLVVDKPAGMPTMGTQPGDETVHSWAADYLKRRYNKRGKAFVGLVSRLDQVTSGVLVLAKTSKSASRLSIQFGGPGKSKKVSQSAKKLYLAMVSGDLERDSGLPRAGMLVDSVWKDDRAYRMRVNRGQRVGAQEARLHYCVIDSSPSRTLVGVRLLTGRKHQIRLQFADRGHPILGDQKYGSEANFSPGVALHSWHLLITHPTKTDPMLFRAAVPPHWFKSPYLIPDESAMESTLIKSADWYDE